MKYEYGTLDYYDFELKKKAFTAFAVQCLMRDEIMGGKHKEELEVMAAALIDADRAYQNAINDLERSVKRDEADKASCESKEEDKGDE